jgi:hypothetical protein
MLNGRKPENKKSPIGSVGRTEQRFEWVNVSNGPLGVYQRMGYFKEKAIEDAERGFTLPKSIVCADHFISPVLVKTVTDGVYENHCDYCTRTGNDIGANLSDVVEVVGRTFWSHWDRSEDILSWDSSEGGWQGSVEYASDLLDGGYQDFVTGDVKLWDDIRACFQEDFLVCEKHYGELGREEVLRFGWQTFVEMVKHETRFVFLAEVRETDRYERTDGILPSAMLPRLGELVRAHDLVRRIEPGVVWFRAREHPGDIDVTNARDLGTPPESAAVFPNRMSPSGIPMFYGASSEEVAIAEVSSERIAGRSISVGKFVTSRAMLVIDLLDIPDTPDLFDLIHQRERDELRFLRAFTEDLRKPVEKDGEEHVEYVPTQIVTEYFRRIFRGIELEQVDGVIYRSSKAEVGVCCVLFVKSEACTDVTDGWESDSRFSLGLTPHSIRLITT